MSATYSLLVSVALISLTLTGTYGADIINGKQAKKNSLQYMASVQVDGKHKCGGFLIDPSYVLTAAHCDQRGNMTVILGAHNINPDRKNLRRYTVQNKHKHPHFKNVKTGSDIMLLKLSQKLKTSKDVKIVKIPGKGKQVKPNSKCLVAGWGQTERNDEVNDLLFTEVSTIRLTDCQMLWRKLNMTLPDNVLCAWRVKTKSGVGKGDSGGPLVCRGIAAGVVSFKNGPEKAPSIYTDIVKYKQWIENVINGGA
ncbi:granzyme G-like [Myxocyprinus asiaticus]|uniref:granzyme G-like n=1 Tax=Myxocyprinus asiaticus TaxID=70543 RepID=UPI002222DC03|nr:granzyme G-like [Myxocyprinus asiaticus]